jgi:hypothetical protein
MKLTIAFDATWLIGAALDQFDMKSGNEHQKAKLNGLEFPFILYEIQNR